MGPSTIMAALRGDRLRLRFRPDRTHLVEIVERPGLWLDEADLRALIDACPGHTATDLNGFSGHRTTEQGARRAVELALIGPDGPTGTFSDENGPVA